MQLASTVLCLLVFLLFSAATARADDRPNIVYIFSDDHAIQAIGAYGHPLTKLAPTPNLDRIAAEGAIFLNSFCTNSICAPSRAVVLTGVHSHLNGKRDNSTEPFDGSQPTFPKLLQQAGYRTAFFGKWHLRSEPTGFDEWEVLPGQGNYYNPDYLTAEGRHRETGYVDDLSTAKAVEFLGKNVNGEGPFLLWLGFKSPHRSWQPGPKELDLYRGVQFPEPPTLFDDYAGRSPAAANQEMTIAGHMNPPIDLKLTPPLATTDDKSLPGLYRRMNDEQRRQWDAAYADENADYLSRRDDMTEAERTRWRYQRYVGDYLRCIAGVDRNVGDVLDALDRLGLAENTIVVYSSDQGFYLGEHGWYDKRWMYEESLRMPLLMRWPSRIEAGTRVEAMVQNLDHAPSLLSAAKIEVPERMQGKSLHPLIDDQTVEWRDAIYYHYFEFPAVHSVRKHYGVRTNRYKLIRFYGDDDGFEAWELFDLERDPREMKSVYDNEGYGEIQGVLKAKLRDLRRQYGDSEGPAMGSED